MGIEAASNAIRMTSGRLHGFVRQPHLIGGGGVLALFSPSGKVCWVPSLLPGRPRMQSQLAWVPLPWGTKGRCHSLAWQTRYYGSHLGYPAIRNSVAMRAVLAHKCVLPLSEHPSSKRVVAASSPAGVASVFVDCVRVFLHPFLRYGRGAS